MKVKQGHTKWTAYTVKDPDQHYSNMDMYKGLVVAFVQPCFVTAVRGNTIHYTCGRTSYRCGIAFWQRQLQPTYRKALAKARLLIAEEISGG